MKSYIGITGFNQKEQVINTLSHIDYTNTKQTYMFGYLVSAKILQGQQLKNKRYLNFNDISELKELMNISSMKSNIINMVHYNSQEKDFSDEIIKMLTDLSPVVEAIQFNVTSLNIDVYKKIKEVHPNVDLLLQLNQKLEKKIEKSDLINILKSGLFTYVLFDPSGGSGKQIDVDFYKEYVKELPKNISYGFAGGFNPENVSEKVNELNKLGFAYNIDAESGLRDKITDTYGDDIWNQEKVNNYISNSLNKLS